MKNPTLAVVTDRNELDEQLYQQYCMAKDLLKQTSEQADSREELPEMLAVRELGDDMLKKIAIELTEKLRASTTVDWQVRDSIRAKLRNLVRRLLRKYKYPPDQQPETIELGMRQAEALAGYWAGEAD